MVQVVTIGGMMTTAIFLSYSRREAPFVDSLANELEALNYSIWLDYRSLIPSHPWAEQIDAGIVGANVIVLLVSKEALASPYVEQEWQRAIALGKRIVLALFETAPLPPELAHREWVDLRGNFRQGVAALNALLAQPAQPERPAPQTGFRTEPAVWAAFAVSVPLALLSLLAFWTGYIPLQLLPLPLRILRRDFNFFHTQTSLILLPLSLFFTSIIFVSDQGATAQTTDDILLSSFLLSLVLGLTLIFLLHSKTVQRWGKPIATAPKRPKIQRWEGIAQDTLRFAIDFAPEDKKYAEAITSALTQRGHTHHPDIHSADTTLVLLSAYKQSSPCNPEAHMVFPVLLQTTDNIDATLAQIQWVDYRRGLNNLDALAHMLAHPAQLLRTLGGIPGSDQMAMPPVISMLVNFQMTLAIFSAGGLVTWFLQFAPDIVRAGPVAELGCFALLLVFFYGVIIVCIRALMHRQGRTASWVGLIGSMVLIGILIAAQFAITAILPEALGLTPAQEIDRGYGSIIGPMAYVLGLIGVLPVMVWFRHDLHRWFPARPQKSPADS